MARLHKDIELTCEMSPKARLWASIKQILEGFFIGLGVIYAFELVRGWV